MDLAEAADPIVVVGSSGTDYFLRVSRRLATVPEG
jgi:hypothetical protein